MKRNTRDEEIRVAKASVKSTGDDGDPIHDGSETINSRSATGGEVFGAPCASDGAQLPQNANANIPTTTDTRTTIGFPFHPYFQRLKRSFSILNWSSALPTV